LLILPAVITLRHHDGARFAIAAAALVILLASIAFSKRATSMLEPEAAGTQAALPNEGSGHEISGSTDDADVGS
jgi:hypothetical protein